MSATGFSFTCFSAEESAAFAARLGSRLAVSDTVLLTGPIGAGKTHICRHLIQSLLTVPEDVPSPTFTLIQTYNTIVGELLHADLFRLTSPGEVDELGLLDAFDTAVCLVEWPDRLGALVPKDALSLDIRPDQSDTETRHLSLSWTDDKWRSRLEEFAND